MRTVKIRALKDFNDGYLKYKKGDIYEVTRPDGYIKGGVAELYNEKSIKNKTKETKNG